MYTYIGQCFSLYYLVLVLTQSGLRSCLGLDTLGSLSYLGLGLGGQHWYRMKFFLLNISISPKNGLCHLYCSCRWYKKKKFLLSFCLFSNSKSAKRTALQQGVPQSWDSSVAVQLSILIRCQGDRAFHRPQKQKVTIAPGLRACLSMKTRCLFTIRLNLDSQHIKN